MNHKKSLKIAWVLFGCYLLTFFIFLSVISFQTGQSIPSLLSKANLTFYSGRAHNAAFPPSLSGFNILFVFYGSWCFLIVIIYMSQKLFGKKMHKERFLYDLAVFAWIVFFAAAVVLSLISQTGLFLSSIRAFSGKTLEERQELIFKNFYYVPDLIRKDFSGRYRADFLTDMDTSQDPGMFAHRAMAYFLYPIDIRGIRSSEEVEAVILVDKQHAVEAVPDEFYSIFKYSDQFVVAFKGPRYADHFVAE